MKTFTKVMYITKTFGKNAFLFHVLPKDIEKLYELWEISLLFRLKIINANQLFAFFVSGNLSSEISVSNAW